MTCWLYTAEMSLIVSRLINWSHCLWFLCELQLRSLEGSMQHQLKQKDSQWKKQLDQVMQRHKNHIVKVGELLLLLLLWEHTSLGHRNTSSLWLTPAWVIAMPTHCDWHQPGSSQCQLIVIDSFGRLNLSRTHTTFWEMSLSKFWVPFVLCISWISVIVCACDLLCCVQVCKLWQFLVHFAIQVHKSCVGVF